MLKIVVFVLIFCLGGVIWVVLGSTGTRVSRLGCSLFLVRLQFLLRYVP